MPWTEASAGHWTRPIGENEKFIKFIGDKAQQAGREHWSVTSGATFSLNKDLSLSELVEKCSQAWVALRFQHPSIACTADNDQLSYTVPTSQTVKAWCEETFEVHDNAARVNDVIAGLKPSKYTTAHLLPTEGTILLHFSHWRTDGYGALQLVDAFLSHLCDIVDSNDSLITWGEEVRRLTLSIEEVLDLPITPTPEILTATARCLETLAHGKGAVGVALTTAANEKAPRPAGTRSAEFSFDEGETRLLTTECRKREIDLLSAVHASCAALTYQEAASPDLHRHYTSTMRFSLRPHLPSLHCTSQAAAGLYTGGYMFRLPASQAWLDSAKQYRHQYDTGLTKEFLQCRRQYARAVLDRLQQGVPSPDRPPSEIDISSVGDAESLVQPHRTQNGTTLEVQQVRIGVETLTPQTYCFLWTFRGCLQLSLVYNEAFYTANRASRLVRSLGRILMSELGTGKRES